MKIDLDSRYEYYNYGHAYEILETGFPQEFQDIKHCLEAFFLTKEDILKAGGNKSDIPARLDELLFPRGWAEIKISGDLIIKKTIRSSRAGYDIREEVQQNTGWTDGHNIDFVKNRIALDMEWNSKDQTFDRDLMAMRTYHECDIIDVGIILTRSSKLATLFARMGDEIRKKYGASTTHMDKLLYRLDNRRQGGCPILAIGITEDCLQENERNDNV